MSTTSTAFGYLFTRCTSAASRCLHAGATQCISQLTATRKQVKNNLLWRQPLQWQPRLRKCYDGGGPKGEMAQWLPFMPKVAHSVHCCSNFEVAPHLQEEVIAYKCMHGETMNCICGFYR